MPFIFVVILTAIISFSAGWYFYSDEVPAFNKNEILVNAIDTANEDSYPSIKIASSVVHNLGVRHTTVERKDLQRNIETIGKITRVDPMARRIITPPISGELVYIADKQDGDFIERGELLFTIVSEELLDLQKTYQTASLSGDQTAASAMIPQMRQMGLSLDQIVALQNGAEPEFPVEVHASEDSYIFSRRGFVGESVHTGFTVFNVGGHYNVIEVTAEIFERQWSWVETGQTATMTARGLPGSIFEGAVARVQPPVGFITRSLEVALRFNTDDPGLSQSMFVHVSILGRPKKNVLLVPLSSVIRTGNEQRVVLIHDDGSYQPIVVVAGEESAEMVEILSGLQENDKIVTSGQFLIDSESNLLADFSRMSSMDATQAQHVDHHHHH